MKTSRLAIASLVCGVFGLVTGLFTGVPAVICGHLAISKIDDAPDALQGRGMATAGLVLGYIAIALNILIVVWFLVRVFTSVSSAGPLIYAM